MTFRIARHGMPERRFLYRLEQCIYGTFVSLLFALMLSPPPPSSFLLLPPAADAAAPHTLSQLLNGFFRQVGFLVKVPEHVENDDDVGHVDICERLQLWLAGRQQRLGCVDHHYDKLNLKITEE
jgi:hypothetical protein